MINAESERPRPTTLSSLSLGTMSRCPSHPPAAAATTAAATTVPTATSGAVPIAAQQQQYPSLLPPLYLPSQQQHSQLQTQYPPLYPSHHSLHQQYQPQYHHSAPLPPSPLYQAPMRAPSPGAWEFVPSGRPASTPGPVRAARRRSTGQSGQPPSPGFYVYREDLRDDFY